MAIRPKKIMITSLSPLRSLREKKKQRVQPGAKQATPANVGVGFIPILSAKHNVGVGFIPIHQAQKDLQPRRGCEVSIQRMVSDGCRVRPSWPSAKKYRPSWQSAKKNYDHFFASFAFFARNEKKQRAQPVMCECKTN